MTRTPPRRVTALAAAKVNIGWRVGSRRPDGYHDVCGSIHTISLTDRLDAELGDDEPPGRGGVVVDAGGVRLRLRVDVGDLEVEGNLVVKAARSLAERSEARPTTIELQKSIPVTAGLGGGSADAAATLMALNQLWGARLTARDLLELSSSVGSDVPAILLGGLVHVSGRGERVRNLGAASAGVFVLGVGTERISAADAYAAFDGLDASPPASFHHNDLEAAACSIVPALEGRLEAMRTAAGLAFVAGSGPTVVAVASDEAHAHAIVERVRGSFENVLVAKPIDWGVRVVVGAKGGH